MVKVRRVRKLIGLILAGIIFAGFVFHTALNIYAGQRVKEEIKIIQAKGEPVRFKDVVGPSVPDEQNAATIYQKVFALLDANKDELDKVREITWGSDISQWTEEQKEEIPTILAKHDKVFKLLHEASLKPECDFKRDYNEAPGIVPSHFSPLRTCFRLLYVKSTLEKEKGEIEEAVSTVLDAFAAARAVRSDRLMISSLTRIACDAMALKNLQELLTDKEISLESYRTLHEALKEERGIHIIDLYDDRCYGISVWDRILQKKINIYQIRFPELPARFYESLNEQPPHLSPTEKLVKTVTYWYLGSYLRLPLLKLDYVCYLRMMSEAIEVTKKPYWQINKADVFSEERIPKTAFFSRHELPSLARCLLQEARLDATFGTAELAIALRMYRKKNGNYPGLLKELVPDIVRELPLDPFTGKDYLYRQEGNGFVVYSLGDNKKDDGGRGDEPQRWQGDFDIVWRFDK